MPAGLDGHPDPIRSAARSAVLDDLAARVLAVPVERCLVGVDGASGTGKSTMADELAGVLASHGEAVVRASIDSFHRPRADRYRRGPDSPEGYYLDSHDLDALRHELLDPFATGAPAVRTATFDEPTDEPLDSPPVTVPDRAVLVFDGLFLHRPELVERWHVSIFLLAEARRDEAWQRYLTDGLPDDEDRAAEELDRRIARARRHRYVDGQATYERQADPRSLATFTIDNDDLARPTIL